MKTIDISRIGNNEFTLCDLIEVFDIAGSNGAFTNEDTKIRVLVTPKMYLRAMDFIWTDTSDSSVSIGKYRLLLEIKPSQEADIQEKVDKFVSVQEEILNQAKELKREQEARKIGERQASDIYTALTERWYQFWK